MSLLRGAKALTNSALQSQVIHTRAGSTSTSSAPQASRTTKSATISVSRR